MPEYLAPGVSVEETLLVGNPIYGVSTSFAAFLGLTVKGSIGAVSAPIRSYGDFERVYGGDDDLFVAGFQYTNYMAYAVRGFFENGGQRLLVVRVSPPETQAESPETLRPNAFRGIFRWFLRSDFEVPKTPKASYRDALRQLENVAEVSIIAAPSAAHAVQDHPRQRNTCVPSMRS